MVETLMFYMNEASIELLNDRRAYLERVIIPRVENGLDLHRGWSESLRKKPDTIELISVLRSALKFFNDNGFFSNKINS